MRIAVADDEEILLKHLKKTVEKSQPDAEVCDFSTSSALLAAATQTPFDVAFLDIQMPGMSGIEVAKKLKTTNEKINIIFVTGYDGYQYDAFALFASGYVKKPATKEKIQAQLNNLRFPL